MHLRRSVAAAVLAATLAACADEPSRGSPDHAPAPPTPPRTHQAEQPVPRDPRLRDDCGGWEPSADLLDAASKLGDPTAKKDALTELDAATKAWKIDVLRAGLRLRDDAAARACAARLAWQQIDRWECGRCVDLLVEDVMRPGTEADFEEFRSYLGSVELTRYLRALPPLPWAVVPDQAIGQVHRIALGSHLPDYVELTRHSDENVADVAWGDISLLGRWNDEHREDVIRREIENAHIPVPGDAPPGAPGLPPMLAAWLRGTYLGPEPAERKPDDDRVWNEKLRWCWASTPGPRDRELLMALADRCSASPFDAGGVAILLLGRLADPESAECLRRLAVDDEEEVAIWALARRGDAAMIERTAAQAIAGEQFALAALMEADPVRARRVVEDALLGHDDAAADEILDALEEFAVPGSWWEPLGFDWRRTSFDGFERKAIEAAPPVMRLARIGVTVPGCRTRALAESVATRLGPGDLVDDRVVGGFLETAAPDAFLTALRKIRKAGGDDAALATEWLVAMGDPDTAAAVVEAPGETEWTLTDLARSRAPDVVAYLEKRIREERTAEEGVSTELVAALAVARGLPEDASPAFSLRETPLPPAAVDAVLDGRPVESLAAVLAAEPDEAHGAVGAVDDPRVRAYLARLRERRDLGLSWYATGQLAVLGDAAARAEFWGAMQDGRYRIIDESEAFERTLGWDIAATMPFWIDQLRSQCCRIVTGMSGDIVEDVLGVRDGFQSPYRTPYRRARDLWESAGGRFVRSRILTRGNDPRWVPAPR